MFTQFAKILGVPLHAAEDALHSENLAKRVIGRRGFMVGGLALLSSGVAYALPIKQELGTLVVTRYGLLSQDRHPVNLNSASVGALLEGYWPSSVDLYDALGRNLLDVKRFYHRILTSREGVSTKFTLTVEKGTWSEVLDRY